MADRTEQLREALCRVAAGLPDAPLAFLLKDAIEFHLSPDLAPEPNGRELEGMLSDVAPDVGYEMLISMSRTALRTPETVAAVAGASK